MGGKKIGGKNKFLQKRNTDRNFFLAIFFYWAKKKLAGGRWQIAGGRWQVLVSR